MDVIVGVAEGDDLAPGGGDAHVPGVRRADPGGRVDHPEVGQARGHRERAVTGGVGGAVVGDDHLPRSRVRLGGERRQLLGQLGRPVPDRDHDRDHGTEGTRRRPRRLPIRALGRRGDYPPLPVALQVIVAEDNYLVRESVRRLLEEGGLEVLAVCEDYDTLLQAVAEQPPRRRTHRHPHAADGDRRGHPRRRRAARIAPRRRRGRAQPVRRAGVRARPVREGVGAARLPAQGARDRARAAPRRARGGLGGRLGRRPEDRRRAGARPHEPAGVPGLAPHAPRGGDAGRDGPGQEQRRHRQVDGPLGTGRREAHQLDLLEARPLRDPRRAPPGQGGADVPLRAGG